jgi:exosome complex component RRP41
MMSFSKRTDGRSLTDLRPMEAKVGVIDKADGSAYFKIGNTAAYAAVYGPKQMLPRFMQDPRRGVLRCSYSMMPFSGMGERVRPGQNRRAKEISMVTEKALLPVVDIEKFPNSVVDVFIELPQTDAGSRCAGITAAALALADAGIPMKDMVSSVACGKIDDKLLVDLSYEEEAFDGEVCDIPFAFMHNSGKITLLQGDGVVDTDSLLKLFDMAKEAAGKVYEVQRNALLEKYKVEGDLDADQ